MFRFPFAKEAYLPPVRMNRGVISCIHKSSISTKYQESSYKILDRWYRMPRVQNRIFPAISDRCWRCSEETRSLLHIVLSCTCIQSFWGEIKLSEDPAFQLLHHNFLEEIFVIIYTLHAKCGKKLHRRNLEINRPAPSDPVDSKN